MLLFARPTNGVYLPPKIIRLDGKSTVEEIGVVKKDMPNFFVEAVTMADGRVYTETKEIVVPPEKRVLNVEVAAVERSLQAGREGQGEDQADRLHRRAVRRLDRRGDLRQVGRVHLRRPQRAGDQGVLLEVAAAPPSADRIEPRPLVPEPRSAQDGRHERPRRLRRLGGRGDGCDDRRDRRESGMADAARVAMLRHGRPGGRHDGSNGDGRSRRDAWLAAPMAAPPMPMAAADGEGRSEPASNGRRAGAAPMVQPTVRTKFADTALWVGALTTDKDGTAEVSLDMPENLTTWRIKVWGMGHGTRVGQGQTDVVTRKDLIIRHGGPAVLRADRRSRAVGHRA